MTRCYDGFAQGRTARSVSPTLSELSELTLLSRSPSPVPEYDALLHRAANTIKPAITHNRPKNQDGRFISQKSKRARSPDMGRSPKKLRTSDGIPQTPQKTPMRRDESETTSPTPEPGSPTLWVVGYGGFGTLEVLPKEIRQAIYGYAFDIHRPVTVKRCCGPDTTRRERDACRKHGIGSGAKLGAGRFNVFQVSKAVHGEAAWVLFSQGSLHIEVSNAIKPYLKDAKSKSLRHLGSSLQNQNKRKVAMWATATHFRFVTIRIPKSVLKLGDPAKFTGDLLEIACSLCKGWQMHSKAYAIAGPFVRRFVKLDIGTLFHEMLPFNMESQASDKYGELLDWLQINYPCNEPDFGMIAAESEQRLKRLASVIGMYHERAMWKVVARTQIRENDKGGAKGLRAFQISCARNGVVFEHSA